ncbi:MAG: hypothetical protein V2I56_12160 [Desulfobacteraceae bacterium]|jgi:hypothetical protein|nr:hypothetical protein [Desulfobacteraceae bacterium]
MTQSLSLLIFICSLLIAAGPIYAAEGDWVFVEENQGVTIHSRKVDGHAELEFKGTRIINQPVEVVGAVLADIPSYTRWFLNCIQAQKIPDKKFSDLNFLLHIIIKPPWPLWNREVIYDARTRVDIESGKIMVWGKALQDDSVPVKENHVRVTDSAIEWDLERLDDNRARVSFAKRINIGGSIGSYLSDAGCRKTIFESLVNLVRIASDPKYVALGNALKGRYGKSN